MNKQGRFPVVAAFLIGAIIVLLGIGVNMVLNDSSSKPPEKNTAFDDRSFPVYVPKQASNLHLQKTEATYDSESGVLTATIHLHDNTSVSISQQATPEAFSDVPNQYSKMLALLNQYKEVKTDFGTVALTRPKELNGSQSAVVNRQGTLIFVKPARDLSEVEWKEFFSQLSLYK